MAGRVRVETSRRRCGTVKELENALDDPSAFAEQMLSAVGQVGKDIALARLRPKLESHIVRQGLSWAEALPALQLVDSLQELQAAVADPGAFLQNLQAAAGAAGKALLIAKLRPVLTPLLARRQQIWEDVAMAMEMIGSVEDLQKALTEPEAFLDELF